VLGQPLYKQLIAYFKEKIESGEWAVGEQIPSERELCKQFDVSRITVRQAIAEAEKEGLLQAVQGKGTFVAKPKIHQELQQITSFKETMAMWGMVPRTKVFRIESEPADLTIASVLGMTEGEPVVHLELVGYGDQLPMVYYHSTFSHRIGILLAEEAKKLEEAGEGFSTYDLYEKAGLEKPGMVKQTYEVGTASALIGERLQIPEGQPLFRVTSIFSSIAEQPLEFRTAYYRGDKYKFYITRKL
jgi:GntR family transcriptional regulator